MVRLVGVFYEVAEDPLDAASVQKVRQAVVAGYEGELLVGVGQFLGCDGDERDKALNGGEEVIEVQCRVVFHMRRVTGDVCDGSLMVFRFFTEGSGNKVHVHCVNVAFDAVDFTSGVTTGSRRDSFVGTQDLVDVVFQIVSSDDAGEEEHALRSEVADAA